MQIVSKHVFGHREHNFEVRNENDPSTVPNFKTGLINIKLPIFCIHGNHDQLKGNAPHFKSILEIGQTTKLMNYFGKHLSDIGHLEIKPICFSKVRPSDGKKIGVALYGIGHIHDNRLRNYFEQEAYTIHPPSDEGEVKYTKIMVLHQNRYKGRGKGASQQNCLEDHLLPKEIDLFLWGHEHDCYTTFYSLKKSNGN